MGIISLKVCKTKEKMNPVLSNLVWCISTIMNTMSKNIPMIILKTNTNKLNVVLTLMSNAMMQCNAVQTILPTTHNCLFSLFSLNQPLGRFRIKICDVRPSAFLFVLPSHFKTMGN